MNMEKLIDKMKEFNEDLALSDETEYVCGSLEQLYFLTSLICERNLSISSFKESGVDDLAATLANTK